jgi:hypothetical protein
MHRNKEMLPPHSDDSRGSKWQAGFMTAPNYSYRSLSRGPDKTLDKAWLSTARKPDSFH